jgi:tetratricopeptide (TPR) repeat protein
MAMALVAGSGPIALGQGSINRPDPPTGRAPVDPDPAQASTDAELASQLTTVRTQAADVAFGVAAREDKVLEMAATLDRAAQATKNPEAARRHWAEAIDLLDWYTKDNPETPGCVQLKLQAAMFRWSQAQNWLESGRTDSNEKTSRQRAISALEDTIHRLRPLAGIQTAKPLMSTLSFQLAQALCDRASLEPDDSEGRKTLEAEALTRLETEPTSEPAMIGVWHLRRAELLGHVSRWDEAVKELDAAAKATPPPPERQLLEIKVPLLTQGKRFDEAAKAIEGSHLEPAFKGLWLVRVALGRLAGLSDVAERARVEKDLFRWVAETRTTNAPESRQALMELARSGLEPDAQSDPSAFESLAEGYRLAGNPGKAATIALRGAERARTLGKPQEAAKFRELGGLLLYRSGKFLEAEKVWTQVTEDPAAGPGRARAGMLRALALRQALQARQPGVTTARYTAALERQVKQFPTDPSTEEARWLLGEVAMLGQDREKAESIWSAIRLTSNRWLDSRLAIAFADREELDKLQVAGDRQKLKERYERARKFLRESLEQTKDERAQGLILLAMARLEVTPNAGSPESARQLCERVLKLPATAAVHYRANLYRLVSTVELGKYVEAEREAFNHASWSIPSELESLIDTVRLLDQCASTASTDLRQRRFGLVLKILVEPLLNIDSKFSAELRSEVRMRATRAFLFVGDEREARKSLAGWKGLPEASGDRLLRELGDTYARLEVFALEIDVQRLRLQSNPPGTPTWFDARYALALAYYNTGQFKEAQKLIDGTALVHPDLGGGQLKEKFERLRQRIAAKP